MTLTSQLATAIVAGLTASALILSTNLAQQPLLLAATVVAACCVAPLLSRRPAPSAAIEASDRDAEREEGEVKWFNVSKGFGFIRRQNGEEVFVHFRSIRDSGRPGDENEGKRDGRQRGSRARRALRDGQRVTFTVVDGDKGPQAEEVEAQ